VKYQKYFKCGQVCPHRERNCLRCAAHDYRAVRTAAAAERQRDGPGGAAPPPPPKRRSGGQAQKAAPQSFLRQ